MKTHILLAEDAEQTRMTFTTVMQAAGYEVTPAKDGLEALQQIVALKDTPRKIGILITDIRMDGLDGLALLDELAKRGIKLPVLAITGFSDKDVVIELMRRGCSEYIEKPFEAWELIESVERVLKKVS